MPLQQAELELLSRMARKVRLNAGPYGTCWEWTGNRPNGKYGHVSVKNKAIGAHRASYEMFCGPILPGEVVRHRCDNPCCINPAHLETGTYAENTRDAVERGRWRPPTGEKSHFSRVKEADVIAIRKAAAAKVTYRDLAARYGISQSQICNIVHRRCWSHV